MTEYHLINDTVTAISLSEMTAEQMRIENEVKALLFSRYYIQEVFTWPNSETLPELINGCKCDFVSYGIYNNGPIHLLLRSISDLTDEECIEIAKIVFDEIPNGYQINITKDVLLNSKRWNVENQVILRIYEYLRLCSFALTYIYLSPTKKPVTLSVDELGLLGWVKLLKA